ncbi:MAG TPA: FAD/NAD(P)-binding oxidoreductase [Actinomycetota bacterium]|nr:FAD/NAD(P)-binding oxidoreductase [Actinomycetota bacterium]HNL52747.1 FAD/NAD(P)-binding oxidoreductase [Actinomycetota bacterium]HNO16046.1 FAD/NAD(P)-binding oxidoreductase [Actinomycetota bacterium]HUM86993.1 FAD/NAD(P)-binding oxidoreductase [Actinomycetota bacterium]
MSDLSRRQLLFLGATGVVGAAAGAPLARNLVGPANAATAPVVVVGGGMAGVTVAKYIRLWSGRTIPVTLIESNVDYTSNIMSNLVLNGQRTLTSLKYAYSSLASTYGVNVVQGTVTGVNPDSSSITYATATGSRSTATVSYSRLVMAPGIDFLKIPNLTGTAANQARIVHAWQAGPQTQSLRDQLVAMPKDGVFIITIPAKPYRCPPGPYERACVVADWIKANKRSTGSTSPQVIILDANPSIQAEAANFTTAFTKIHAGVIKYVPNATVQAVNADTRTITTTAGRFTGHVLNVIPDHTAGRIARDAGLATSMTAAGGAFCPVDVLTYESLVRSGIHVLGDASATSQPKAGHVANQEAKVCADAIVRLMASPALPVDQAPITNSACYSPITATTASWLSVVYHYDPVGKTMVPAAGQPQEARSITTGNYSQMKTWFSTLMQDTFK